MKKKEINFILPSIAGFYTKDIIEEEVRNFKEKNKNIRINVYVFSWTKLWDILVDIMKRRSSFPRPDIVAIGNTWLGTALHFDSLVDISAPVSTIPEEVFLSKLVKGKTVLKYSLPWFSDIRVLYYRKDILEKIGMDKDEIKSIEGFIEACERIEKNVKNIYPFAISGQKEEILIHDLFPWLYTGGKFYRKIGKRLKFYTEKVYEGAKIYFKLVKDYYLPYRLGLKAAPPGNFFTGDYAFQVSGTYPRRTIFNRNHSEYKKEVAENYGISLLPSQNGKSAVTYIGGVNLVIPYKSSDVLASFEFMKFLVSPESQLRCVSSLGMLPSRIDCFDEFFLGEDREIKDVFKKSARKGKVLDCIPFLGTIEKRVTYFTSFIFRFLLQKRYSDKLLWEKVKELVDDIEFIERW